MVVVKKVLNSPFGEWCGRTMLSRRFVLWAMRLNILVAVGSLVGPFALTESPDHLISPVWLTCGMIFGMSIPRFIAHLKMIHAHNKETDELASEAGVGSLAGALVIFLMTLPDLTGWSVPAVTAVLLYWVITGLGALAYPALRKSAEEKSGHSSISMTLGHGDYREVQTEEGRTIWVGPFWDWFGRIVRNRRSALWTMPLDILVTLGVVVGWFVLHPETVENDPNAAAPGAVGVSWLFALVLSLGRVCGKFLYARSRGNDEAEKIEAFVGPFSLLLAAVIGVGAVRLMTGFPAAVGWAVLAYWVISGIWNIALTRLRPSAEVAERYRVKCAEDLNQKLAEQG